MYTRVDKTALNLALEADLGPLISHYELKAARDGVTMWPGASPLQVKVTSLIASCWKKFQDGASDMADELAVRKFISVNRSLSGKLMPLTEYDALIDGELRSSLVEFWRACGEPEHPYDLLSRGQNGPGAAIGARATTHYAKSFASPLTCTSASLYQWYSRYLRGHPESSIAEQIRALEYGDARVVRGSKLHLVPKTTKVSRVICVEPSLNMFYQQGLRFYLEKGLMRMFGIDLSLQADRNRDLARVGSLDGSIATIDLSSASDSLSLRVCEQTFPIGLYRWVTKLRCAEVELPSGEWVALNMVSSMGNAFTFPLQTAFFACVVSACALVADRPLDWVSPSRNCSVFGDDIICPADLAGLVCRTLERYGFRINADKTFVEGLFRESCGHDYYCGHLVRGVYLKTLLRRNSACIAYNRLLEWACEGEFISLVGTLDYLLRCGEFLPVPWWEQADAGFRFPFERLPNTGSMYDRNGSIRYRAFFQRSRGYRLGQSSIRSPGTAKVLIYNPPGLLQSILRGEWNGGTMSVRQADSRIATEWRVAPNWCYASNVSQDTTRRLENAFAMTFVL